MTADALFYHIKRNIRPFDHNFIPHHNCWGHGQVQLKPGIGLVLSPGL
jgi:hypothetical protein